MKRKGVSPVIATVLLIGMVIALALIVFIWTKSFTKETITKFDDENIELACQKVEYQASMEQSGNISLSNSGNVPIYDFRVKTFDAGAQTSETMRKDGTGFPKAGLNPGDAALVGGFSGENIIIIPILLGNSDEGKKTFVCENQEYEL